MIVNQNMTIRCLCLKINISRAEPYPLKKELSRHKGGTKSGYKAR
jgi:hypothetical protein